MIYVITQGQIAMKTTDTNSQTCFGVHPGQLRIQHVDFGKVLRNPYGAPSYRPTKLLVAFLEQHRIASNLVLEIFQMAKIQTPPSRNTYLLYPSMASGAIPETFLEIP